MWAPLVIIWMFGILIFANVEHWWHWEYFAEYNRVWPATGGSGGRGDSSKISLICPCQIENIHKLIFNFNSYDDATGNVFFQYPNESSQRHVWHSNAFFWAIGGRWNIDTGIALPIFIKRIELGALSRSVIDYDVGNEISSWGLPGVGWNEFYSRVSHFSHKMNDGVLDADICPCLSFANPFRISGLKESKYSECYSGTEQSQSCIEQGSGKKSQLTCQFDKSPLKLRFFLAIAGLFLFFGFGFLGGRNIYNNRRLRGWLLIGGGGLLWLVSFGLLWLSRFPTTWGWPL